MSLLAGQHQRVFVGTPNTLRLPQIPLLTGPENLDHWSDIVRSTLTFHGLNHILQTHCDRDS